MDSSLESNHSFHQVCVYVYQRKRIVYLRAFYLVMAQYLELNGLVSKQLIQLQQNNFLGFYSKPFYLLG